MQCKRLQKGMQVETFKVGSYHVTRIEEMLTPGFTPAFLLPDFDAQVMQEHPVLAGERFWDSASGRVMSSMHSWMIRDEHHTVLIDTGCGNDKSRGPLHAQGNEGVSGDPEGDKAACEPVGAEFELSVCQDVVGSGHSQSPRPSPSLRADESVYRPRIR